jgi:hypothetical protein
MGKRINATTTRAALRRTIVTPAASTCLNP